MILAEKPELADQLTEREKEILGRLIAGLSDQQIAADLFLSPNTVRWYNRQIYSKLGVGSRTQAIARAKSLRLLENGVSVSPSPNAQYHLPAQMTPFIGRDREAAEVKQLLEAHRLLTLTGTGGIGKTRLALRVAAEMAESLIDGVYFVDLAPVSVQALVANAIASALGVTENLTEPLPNTLKRLLAGRRLLLLIDNFEHVIEAAPLVSDLLTACPHLKVMVTSREPLHISGEQEYPVAPLSLPAVDAQSIKQLTVSEAGALFIRRAQMTQPHFEVKDESVMAIAQICNHLDGVPLAIELAAARIKLLTPKMLLERMQGKADSPLHALTSGMRDAPPRQRTLRDSIEWSYDLLNESDCLLFARLAVFRGGCSLQAIESICGEALPIPAFEALESLVDKSLVQQKETTTGELRYTLLEMIHEYAAERLEAGIQAERLRRRHAEYFVMLAEQAEPELRLARFDDWCEQFELEVDNLRAVLEWALGDEDVSLGVRLAGALGMFWYGKGYHVEGGRWCQQLLQHLDDVPVIYRAKFLITAGHMIMVRDLGMAQRLFQRALDISRELGDSLQRAWALTFAGYTMQRDLQTAVPTVEAGLALFRTLDYLPGIAQALNIIGEITRLHGDYQRARRAYEECLSICQQTGEVRRICYMYHNLAFLAQHEGDFMRAAHLARQSLQLARDRNAVQDMATALATLSSAVSTNGQPRSAARLLGASQAAFEQIGAFFLPTDMLEIDRITAAIRTQLGDSTFDEAWAEGRKMNLEQAVEYALA